MPNPLKGFTKWSSLPPGSNEPGGFVLDGDQRRIEMSYPADDASDATVGALILSRKR
jgi:hypothetical protein